MFCGCYHESRSGQFLKLLGDCYCMPMKFGSLSHFDAAHTLVQIANASEVYRMAASTSS